MRALDVKMKESWKGEWKKKSQHLAGFEPMTSGLGVRRSNRFDTTTVLLWQRHLIGLDWLHFKV